jgi:hypothetical protein
VTLLKTHIDVREGSLHAGHVPPNVLTSWLLMAVLRKCDDGNHRLGLHRNQQLDEIGGNIPAPALGGARISQHAAANGAHAMSKLEGAP